MLQRKENSETVKQITLNIEQYNNKNIKNENDPSRFKTKRASRSHVNKKAAKKLFLENNKKTHFKAASIFSNHLDDHFKKNNSGKSKESFGNKTQDNFQNFTEFDEPWKDDENCNNNYTCNNGSVINWIIIKLRHWLTVIETV
jgi:hypothetical protein